jgi:hypothetical protein
MWVLAEGWTDSLKKRRSLALALTSMTACAGAPAPPAQPAAAPVEHAAAGTLETRAPPACPAGVESTTACEARVCVDGVWQRKLAAPRTVCELTPDFAERQALVLHDFRGDPGVCYEGECVPRLLCADRCGAKLGIEEGTPIFEDLKRCRRDDSLDASRTCAELALQDQGLALRLGRKVLGCLEVCGFSASRFENELAPTTAPQPAPAN